MKAYKATDKNMKCQGFQFELGKTYIHEGKIELCKSGFHFCVNPGFCFDYYNIKDSLLFEVEILGEVIGNITNKQVTNKIKFIKRVNIKKLFDNKDKFNTGNKNTGNRNTGNSNTGNRNTGNYNTGNSNTGNRNTGNRNTGDWNECNSETGFFNTKQSKYIRVFNKKCLLKEWTNTIKPDFIYFNLIGDDYKKSFYESWKKAPHKDKVKIKNLPNFDIKIFSQISGISIKEIEKELNNDSRINK